MTDVVDKNIKILSAALSNNVVDKFLRQRRDLINNIERGSNYYNSCLSEQRKLKTVDNEVVNKINKKYEDDFVNAANFLKDSSLIDYYEVEGCNSRYLRIKVVIKNIPMKREKKLSRATIIFDVNAPDEINSERILNIIEKNPGSGLFSIRLRDCCIFQNPETGNGTHTTNLHGLWNQYISEISKIEDEESAILDLPIEVTSSVAEDFVSKYVQWVISILSELKFISDNIYFEENEEIYNSSILELSSFDIKRENIKDQIEELLSNREEENEND